MAGKGDVINAIAEQAGISKKEAAAAFDAFVAYISDSCQRGERCAIPGLGSFAVSQRKAREGRNPRTNEKIRFRPRRTSVSRRARICAKRVNAEARRRRAESARPLNFANAQRRRNRGHFFCGCVTPTACGRNSVAYRLIA